MQTRTMPREAPIGYQKRLGSQACGKGTSFHILHAWKFPRSSAMDTSVGMLASMQL